MTQTATKTREAPNRRTASLPIRSKYDAAQTTGNNRRHWALADALSANAANSPEIRAIIRARARYEMANNSWAKGMALTLAKATIGKGPRLQMNTPNRELNRTAEALWIRWSRRVRLAAKLRTMRMARVSDGEAFGLIGINKGLDSQIDLDLRLIEADQIASPQRLARNFLGGADIVDGIQSDSFGNPTAYYVLPNHPGSDSLDVDLTARRIEARQVIHWQREDRPGTHRAVPEITPALPLFAQLRRYTLAVVDAAETAADYSVIFYTDLLPPDTGAAEVPEASEFGTIELERRMATFVPDGWKAAQMKAEQPTTLYDTFVRSIINEIARCLEMPLNIASGNSGGYNFASGRLDGQGFHKFIEVERDDCEVVAVEPLFAVWLRQLTLLTQFAEWRNGEESLPHQFFWDGNEPVDPVKEAAAQSTRLVNGATTLAAEYASQGKDWETQQEQRVREKLNKIQLAKDLASEYGLSEEEAIGVVTAGDQISVNIGQDKDSDQ
jgi:capsid protein